MMKLGPSGPMAPSSAHVPASAPLENSQWPERRKPPSTGVSLPAGAKELDESVSGPVAKYSSCSAIGQWPIIQLWIESTE